MDIEKFTDKARESIGEAQSFGGTLRVKVTMAGDKIAKIDILSHSDTAGGVRECGRRRGQKR